MNKLRHPIIKYGWRDAALAVQEGASIQSMALGHAEIWKSYTQNGVKIPPSCIGYMTKESYQLYRELGLHIQTHSAVAALRGRKG